MSRSMRRLRTAAFDVAEQRLPMLVDQLSRTEPGRVDTRVEPIPIDSTDEIGEVARAFDQVHREAVRLAAEQALLRGNVNAIFTNLSRRNQSLIEGQLTLITDLENNEADPDQLESLFRLDHLATRMRRNGENLLVLAGEEPGRRWDQPVPLVDVLRAASSEVESYERIELSGRPGGRDPRPRRDRPRAPAGRAAGERHHVLLPADQGPRHRDPAARRPRDGRDPRQGHRPDRRGLRGHQPPAGQPADRGRRGLPAHGPVRGRPARRPARHPRPAAPLGRAGRHHLARHAPRRRSPTVAAARARRWATTSRSPRSSPSSTSSSSRTSPRPPRCARPPSSASTTRGTSPEQAEPRELDPVNRSLMREERRAALEAQAQGGERPLYRDEVEPQQGQAVRRLLRQPAGLRRAGAALRGLLRQPGGARLRRLVPGLVPEPARPRTHRRLRAGLLRAPGRLPGVRLCGRLLPGPDGRPGLLRGPLRRPGPAGRLAAGERLPGALRGPLPAGSGIRRGEPGRSRGRRGPRRLRPSGPHPDHRPRADRRRSAPARQPAGAGRPSPRSRNRARRRTGRPTTGVRPTTSAGRGPRSCVSPRPAGSPLPVSPGGCPRPTWSRARPSRPRRAAPRSPALRRTCAAG